MQPTAKRTFIPPQNRPTIRGAELRSTAQSRHYLAVFNHGIRRRQFLQQLATPTLTDPAQGERSRSDDAPPITIESIFGVKESEFKGLLADLQLTSQGE